MYILDYPVQLWKYCFSNVRLEKIHDSKIHGHGHCNSHLQFLTYNALPHTVNQFMYFIGPTVNISNNHTWLHAILWSLIKWNWLWLETQSSWGFITRISVYKNKERLQWHEEWPLFQLSSYLGKAKWLENIHNVLMFHKKFFDLFFWFCGDW